MRLVLGLAGLFCAAGLFAQDADIVVTATREPAPAMTLPVPVIVLGPDDLAGKLTVAEALRGTLGVRLQSQTPGEPVLTAPGFGENGFGRVSLLLDGVSQDSPDLAPPPVNLIPLWAVERIEIVRGPLSALYGTGASAGAVDVITKIPRRVEFQVTSGFEDSGTNRETLAFGAPVGDGGLLLSLQRDQDLPARERSDSGRLQGWTKLDLPLGSQRVGLWGALTQGKAQLPGGLSREQYDDNPDDAVNPADQVSSLETTGGAAWSWSEGGWKVSAPLSGLVRELRNTTPSYFSYSDSTLVRGTWAPQLTVRGDLGGADAEWSAGLGLQADRLVVKRYADGTFATVSVNAQLDRWTGSVWSRSQLAWDDRWFLSAAVRAEISRTQAQSAQVPEIGKHRDFVPLAGDAGLTWLPSEGWKAAVQLARVYRYPFIDEMVSYYGFGTDAFLTDVDAEVGHSATLSGEWSNSGWKVAASGTVLRMENEVDFDTTTFTNANLGPTWHASSLVSVSWKTGDGPQAVSLGTEYNAERAVFASGNTGKTVPLIPLHRGRLWARADNRLGYVEASWTVSSSFYQGGDKANSGPTVPGRQSLDIGVTGHLGSEWTIKLYGRNLTGDRTPDYVYYGAWYPSEGRVFGAAVTWAH